jgi:uncharacterized RDD family membrane protein YckC
MINTLGAVMGYYCVPLIANMIPSPFDNKHTLTQGSEVSFFQRCIASFLDFGFVFCTCILMIVYIPCLKTFLFQGRSLWRFPIFYILFLTIAVIYAMLFQGGTLGIKLTGLRLVTAGGEGASRFRCAMRFLIICTSVIAIPF